MSGPGPGGTDFGGLVDVLNKRPAPTIAREDGAWAYVPDEATQALQDRIVGVAGNGAPLGDLFDSFGADAADQASALLTGAMATGTNPLMIAAQLAQVLQIPEARAETIARTELVGAYRDAQLANYRLNDDVVRSWMWSAGPGCCVACMFMDGSVHPLYESMDSHANCRCSPIPVTDTWANILAPLGIDASDIPETSIAASYQPMSVSFLNASPAEQLAILGPAKFGAWMQGDIHLDELVGVRDAGKWGKQVYEKSLKELGLNAQDYLVAGKSPYGEYPPLKEGNWYRADERSPWVRQEPPPLPPEATTDAFAPANPMISDHYELARWGYDAPIPADLAAKLPDSLAGATRISDLMRTSEGREWWQVNGRTFTGVFDMTPGSASLRTYHDYVAELGFEARDPAAGPPIVERYRERYASLPEGERPGTVVRTGTYPDGRQWTVHEYNGPTPPPAGEQSIYAGIGREDGERFTPQWFYKDKEDRWQDINLRWGESNGEKDTTQCLRCYRIYDGPTDGEYPGHFVAGSHGYCPECAADDAPRAADLRDYLTRRYPDMSTGEVEQRVRAALDAQAAPPGYRRMPDGTFVKIEPEPPAPPHEPGPERPSALPADFQQRVADTLGRDTASEWADALGEHGQLAGPIAEREEIAAWTPKAASADVSDALSEQLGVKVNLDELHPAAANQFAQTLQVLHADFPEVFREQLEYIGQTGRDWSKLYPESTLGRSRSALAASNGPGIGFNRFFWSDAKTDLADLTALLHDRVETGWFFDGYDSPAATLGHEFGHSLYRWGVGHENPEITQFLGDYMAKWSTQFNGISAYAMTDAHEAFAEAFAAHYFGSAEVLADPMVQDMGRLLDDIRATLDAGTGAVERAAAEDAARVAPEMDTRLRELPQGTSVSGPERMRYEEWRMTREDQPAVMVFDAHRRPLFADTWSGAKATQLTDDQRALIDVARRPRGENALDAVKVAIWKPEGDGLTPAEFRWAVDHGANEIHVLTPNGVDVLRAGHGPKVGGSWTPQWVRETVMPLVKDAQSDAYHELLADELGQRAELPPAVRTPRANDYSRMELRIQAKLPERVWSKVADQVPGLEYEHLPLPKQGATGEIPKGWQPPKPLLPEKAAVADVERFAKIQTTLTREDLAEQSMAELRQTAREMEITPARTKAETIERILAKQVEGKAPEAVAEVAAKAEPAVEPAVALRTKLDESIARRELLYSQQHDLQEEIANLENQQRFFSQEGAELRAKQDLYRETLDKSDPEVRRYFKDRAAYQKAQSDVEAAKASQHRAERVMDRLSVQGKQHSAEFAQAKADYDAAVAAEKKAAKASDKAYQNLWSKSPSVYKPELDSIAGFESRFTTRTFGPDEHGFYRYFVRTNYPWTPEQVAAKVAAERAQLTAAEKRAEDLKAQIKAMEKPIKAANAEVNKLLKQARELGTAVPADTLDATRPFSGVIDLPEGHQPPNALMNKIDYRMHEPRAVTKGRIIDDIATRLKDNPAWQAYVERAPRPNLGHLYHDYVPDYATAKDTKSAQLVADWIKKWGVGYRPGSPQWVAMQMAARDEFGLDATIHALTPDKLTAGEAFYSQNGDAIRALMRAMYDNTQQWFADNGITEIEVYRGFAWRKGDAVPADINWGPITAHNRGVTDIELNPFQSFSADINISQGTTQVGGFGGGFAQGKDYNLLIGARVPVDRVLSTAQTGFGAKLESEIVVMGRATDTVAYRAGTRDVEALLKRAEEQVVGDGGRLYILGDGTRIQVLANDDGTYTLSYLEGPQAKLGNSMKVGASKTYKNLATVNRNLKAMGLSNVYVAP